MLAAVPPWKQGPLQLVGPWGQGHSRASEATSSTFSCGDPGSGALPSHILSRGRASRGQSPSPAAPSLEGCCEHPQYDLCRLDSLPYRSARTSGCGGRAVGCLAATILCRGKDRGERRRAIAHSQLLLNAGSQERAPTSHCCPALLCDTTLSTHGGPPGPAARVPESQSPRPGSRDSIGERGSPSHRSRGSGGVDVPELSWVGSSKEEGFVVGKLFSVVALKPTSILPKLRTHWSCGSDPRAPQRPIGRRSLPADPPGCRYHGCAALVGLWQGARHSLGHFLLDPKRLG